MHHHTRFTLILGGQGQAPLSPLRCCPAGLSLACGLLRRLGWLISKTRQSACRHLPSAGNKNYHFPMDYGAGVEVFLALVFILIKNFYLRPQWPEVGIGSLGVSRLVSCWELNSLPH